MKLSDIKANLSIFLKFSPNVDLDPNLLKTELQTIVEEKIVTEIILGLALRILMQIRLQLLIRAGNCRAA